MAVDDEVDDAACLLFFLVLLPYPPPGRMPALWGPRLVRVRVSFIRDHDEGRLKLMGLRRGSRRVVVQVGLRWMSFVRKFVLRRGGRD